MDKIVWLRVIKEELRLLDQLATGMIEDSNLSLEEAELAVARSKVVVREFEMLLKHLPDSIKKESPVEVIETAEEQPVQASPVLESVLYINSDPEPQVLEVPVQEPEPEPIALPVPEPIIVPEPEPEIQPLPEPIPQVIIHEIAPVQTMPQLQVPPAVSIETYSVETAEQNVLNMEEHKEHPSQFKAAPLRSLKEGLSLNDRYLFQRELFNNDKSRLDETIAALDQLTSIKDAVEYMKARFRWNKSEAAEKFVLLVKRRFS